MGKQLNNTFSKIVAVLMDFWLNKVKPGWSRVRWGKHVEDAGLLVPEVKQDTMRDFLYEAYASFKWTADGITQLFDAYQPIPFAWNQCKEAMESEGAKKFKGDCDDYHAMVYHVLTQNGFDCALITLMTKPLKNSHTMCMFIGKDQNGDNKYYVVDYNMVLGAYDKIEDFINGYRHDTRYWCLHKFNYDARKYYQVEPEEFSLTKEE